jgi:hypothetical protein
MFSLVDGYVGRGTIAREYSRSTQVNMPASAAHRHGWTCSGHPRLWFNARRKNVDARDERGHDEDRSLG